MIANLYTWSEARARLCPQAMAAGRNALAAGSGPACCADACMAWRWHHRPRYLGQADCHYCKGTGTDSSGESRVCSECEGDGKVALTERVGFCGLAGHVK